MTTIILGLDGSLRPGSVTTLALRIALEGAEETGISTQLLDLATLPLPLFNGTYSLEEYTPEGREAILTLLNAVRRAQGFIFASPTYHNTISGSLKNALDYIELLKDDHPPRLEGKVVGLMSVQLGVSGTGNHTITTMLLAARAMRAWVTPTMVAVPDSRQMFNEEGQPYDPTLLQRLHILGAEVAQTSEMFASNWPLTK